jgi:Asp-tRNA(Asn)/Glu-tRNA(Gln) amidotransferase A subunit family amidase
MAELIGLLDEIEALCVRLESEVRALMPEEDRFGRLRREAAELERRYPESGSRPPLYGLLVGVKDLYQVDDFPTTAGSRLPPEELAGPQAECVTRLRDAGALILGKTVSTEFAYFAPGPTRNPRNPESGSAAAVAAGYCPLALGTQTFGSITRPASFCGVVGYKPSYDRISRAGLLPLSPSLDHVGVLAESAATAARAAAVMCERWRPAVVSARPLLGVPEGPYLELASEAGRQQFRDVCERLSSAGYEVKPVPALADIEAIRERQGTIVDIEAVRSHSRWYPRLADLYHPKTRELIERGLALPEGLLEELLPEREALRRGLIDLMDANGLDLWISPSATGTAPRGLESTGDPAMNVPWTQAGLPTVGLPSGVDGDGLPYGLQLAGRWWADESVLAWGERIEGALV